MIPSCNHVIALRGVAPIRDGVEERSDVALYPIEIASLSLC